VGDKEQRQAKDEETVVIAESGVTATAEEEASGDQTQRLASGRPVQIAAVRGMAEYPGGSGRGVCVLEGKGGGGGGGRASGGGEGGERKQESEYF